jgi:hypothetical protein
MVVDEDEDADENRNLLAMGFLLPYKDPPAKHPEPRVERHAFCNSFVPVISWTVKKTKRPKKGSRLDSVRRKMNINSVVASVCRQAATRAIGSPPPRHSNADYHLWKGPPQDLTGRPRKQVDHHGTGAADTRAQRGRTRPV